MQTENMSQPSNGVNSTDIVEEEGSAAEVFVPMIADDSSLQQVDGRNYGQEVKEDLEWMLSHVKSLAECDAGSAQLKRIHESVCKKISTYRQHATKNQQARSQPRTWCSSDTVCLP